jgi:hypothetical protein
MSGEIVRLPLPARLEPQGSEQTLLPTVRRYFYRLYNVEEDGFRVLLESTGNKDAITGNRLFDRYEAVKQVIVLAASEANEIIANAKAGAIYQCIVTIMRGHGHSHRLRRLHHHQMMAAE